MFRAFQNSSSSFTDRIYTRPDLSGIGSLVTASTAAAVSLLLDTYPDAIVAYSTRKLRTAYTGSALRVRRSSDNTEQDIGFTATNDLDESALTTFVGANDGFVVRWYNQASSSYSSSILQSTTANQATIVSSGTVTKINSKPTLDFDTTDFYTSNEILIKNTTHANVFSVHQYKNVNTDIYAVYDLAPSVGFGLTVDSRSSPAFMKLWTGGLAGNVTTYNFQPAANTTYLTSNIQNPSTSSNTAGPIWVNNVQYTSSAYSIFGQEDIIPYSLGSLNNFSSVLNGRLSEFIFYPTDQSANRVGIQDNINAYYSIY